MKRKLPLDYVIFCDMKFSNEISMEHPLMAEWIPQAEIKIRKIMDKQGYSNVPIKHLTAKRNFTEQFYTKKQRGKHIGDIYGFPFVAGAWCNGSIKLEPIRTFLKNLIKQGYNVIEYIGIAKDEPERLERYKELTNDRHKYITLADLGITETQAMDICRQNDLLSPKYKNSFRSGCWACVKQSNWDLYQLWKDYPKYFNILEEMEKDSHCTFKPNKTLKQFRKEFENGKIPKRRK